MVEIVGVTCQHCQREFGVLDDEALFDDVGGVWRCLHCKQPNLVENQGGRLFAGRIFTRAEIRGISIENRVYGLTFLITGIIFTGVTYDGIRGGNRLISMGTGILAALGLIGAGILAAVGLIVGTIFMVHPICNKGLPLDLKPEEENPEPG